MVKALSSLECLQSAVRCPVSDSDQRQRAVSQRFTFSAHVLSVERLYTVLLL